MKRSLLRRLVLILALLAPVPVLAASHGCKPVANAGTEGEPDEAAEVSSNARETVSSPKGMQAWLKRVVGRYTYDGYVDLCGKASEADRRTVRGRADCVAVSRTPDVHCTVNVNWPSARAESGAPVLRGVPNPAPAQFLFSIEPPNDPFIPPPVYIRGEGANHWGIVLVQVDNNGTSEWNSGVLVGDTFLSTEVCVDVPGNCRRTTRITARPDSDEISMTVEVNVDHQRVLRQAFLLRRVADVRNGR